METAQPFCAALMRTYSAIALHAPKEQLLSRVDKEILGDILRLSGAAQRVGAWGAWGRDAWVPQQFQPLGAGVYRDGQRSLCKALPRKDLSFPSISNPAVGSHALLPLSPSKSSRGPLLSFASLRACSSSSPWCRASLRSAVPSRLWATVAALNSPQSRRRCGPCW